MPEMITKPTLLIDEQKCRANIKKMAAKAEKHRLQFRPHFKTHQSLEIGRWFKEAVVASITVSSVTMADYFATDWDEITIAFPVNILEMDAINALATRVHLNLLVENEESVRFLHQHLGSPVGVFVKIDVGTHRTGLNPHDLQPINSLLEAIAQGPVHRDVTIKETTIKDAATNRHKLRFKGFLAHAGHTYQCHSRDEVLRVHKETLALMAGLKQAYQDKYPDLMISIGDTPGCSVAEDFSGVDEIRPGNFVFYDLTQHQIGSNAIEEIAVVLACPVVAIHEERSEVVVYGGGVHLSKERMEEGRPIFGKLVQKTKEGWGDLIPGAYVKSVSQEHGIIKMPLEAIQNIRIGDLIYILPVHSCMTADLFRSYVTNDGRIIHKL